jgi:hypothetical protein
MAAADVWRTLSSSRMLNTSNLYLSHSENPSQGRAGILTPLDVARPNHGARRAEIPCRDCGRYIPTRVLSLSTTQTRITLWRICTVLGAFVFVAGFATAMVLAFSSLPADGIKVTLVLSTIPVSIFYSLLGDEIGVKTGGLGQSHFVVEAPSVQGPRW